MKVKVSADRVYYFCPGCKRDMMIPIKPGKPNGWDFNGDVESPTLSPSVLTRGGGPRCHCFMRNGKIEFLSDCEHDLAGKTVEMPEFEVSEE